MLGLFPYQFRFRGKLNRLLDIYHCFLANEHQALHPMQIARTTGISMVEVNRRLEATPELFVKLPRRADGMTRYRLTSAVSAQSEDQVQSLLNHAVRKESFLLYALGSMLLLGFLIIVVMIAPAL